MVDVVINGKFITQRITGVQRYAREIIKELDKMVLPGEIEIAIPECDVKLLPDLKNIKIVKIGNLNGNLWEQFSLPLYAIKNKKVILSMCNSSPIIKPDVVCIHDVKIKVRPQDYSRKFLIWYKILFSNAMKRAKKIITVSGFSKKEILKYYNVQEDKVEVISNSWQHYNNVGFDENTLSKYKLEKGNYFFSMCSLEPNKNFKWIAGVAKKNPELIFAVAGSINKSVFREGLGFDCPENMRLLGYVSDEEAKTLMRDCNAFLFPTFYEGFGIPPLEALSAGAKSIVVSDTEIMHEIFEDSVTYINPNEHLIPDIVYIDNEKKEKILLRYSWEVSAIRLKMLLENL